MHNHTLTFSPLVLEEDPLCMLYSSEMKTFLLAYRHSCAPEHQICMSSNAKSNPRSHPWQQAAYVQVPEAQYEKVIPVPLMSNEKPEAFHKLIEWLK